MVDITPTKSSDNKVIRWSGITENDTALPVAIQSGKHTVEFNGTFGSATGTLQAGYASNDLIDIDTEAAPAGLSFTAQGLVNFELAGMFVAPDFSGGSSQSIDVIITKLD